MMHHSSYYSRMSLYRPNVAAIFQRSDGRILICERIGTLDAWQFPQGGIDAPESAEEALYRESEEEVGFEPSDYTIASRYGLYRYEYPPEVMARKKIKNRHCIGQEQTYFLCTMRSDTRDPDINQQYPEFQQFRWIKPEEFLLSWLPDFKKSTYKQVFTDIFHLILN